MRRVVVTGLGVIAPNGNGLNAYKEALWQMRSGITFHEKLKELNFGCQIGGAPKNIEELRQKHFNEEDQRSINEALGLACLAGLECWKDGKMPDPASNPDLVHEGTGAIVGVGLGGMDTIANTLIPMVNAGRARRMGSTIVENVMASGASARLGGFLGLGGQVTTNSSACTTGTEAITDAYFKIKEGRVERMIAGGVEGSAPPIWAGFDAMRVLPTAFNDTPEKGSRPMSATSQGFVPGSGAGLLMLEDLDVALKRGARIYAEILGAEVNSGGQRGGGSMTAPGPLGVIRCIHKAMQRAGITAKEIDLINGHLTGTFADPHEIANWAKALQLPPAEFPLIQATKSLIGHGLGAAGGMECVAAMLQLEGGFVHGSLNCEDLHSGLAAYSHAIPQKSIKNEIKIVAKASFGFGDVNGCIIFKKWE
jgi:3-oxoacyl-(acyl-carrier-protein) synthase